MNEDAVLKELSMIARMAVLPITSDNLIRGKTELALKPPLLQALNNIFNGQSDESFNFTEKLLTEDLSVTFDRFLQIVNRVPTVHLRQRSHHSYANQIDLAVFHNLKFLVLEHINLQLLKWKSHLKSQLVSFSGSFCTGIEAVFCDRLAWAELVDLSLTYCKLEPCNNDHYFLNANWIRILNLSYCNLKSCKFLANLHFLEHLNLSFNFLSEIPTLSDMCEIKTLKMNNNCVIQLTGIEKIRSLKYLDLSFNWLPSKYSLIPLEKAENLVTIKLAGCPVSLIKHYRIYVAMCICTKTLPQMVEIDGVPLNKTEQSTLGLNLLKDKMREQTLHPTNVLAENINVPSTSTNVVEEQSVPSNTPGKSKARSKKPFLRVPVIHDESSSSPIEAESPYLEDEPMDDVPRAPTVVPKGPVASVNFTLTQELRAIQEAILRAPTSQASRTPREHGMQTTIIKPTTSNLHLGSITIPSFINCDDDSPLPEIVPETVFAVVHATESEYTKDGLNQEPEPKTSSEDKLKNVGSTGDLKSSRSRVTFVDEGAPEGNLSYDGTEELSRKMEDELFTALEDRSNLPKNLVQRVKVELVSEFPAASGSESILDDQITVAQDDCKTWEHNSDSGAGSEMKTSSESCEKHVYDDLALQRVDEKVSAEDCSSPNSEEMIESILPTKEEDIVGEATIDEKHSDKSSDDESCYESDAEADEFLWQVMRVDPVSKSNQPIFLALLENELKERSPKSGETLTKWPLDIVLSCVKTKNLPITIEMEFETVKKDKQHREYIMEFADAQALTKKIYNILESRPLSAMNEVSLNCLKCNTIFVYKRPSLFGAKERPPFCPVCGSNVVVEVEEPKMPEKSIPLSQSPSQSSIVIGHGAETPGSSQTSSTPKDSRICSARSMEQGHRTETHSNPRKYESDIEVISNPSQSSIEVIDESSRSQSATPMRKKSEERQTVLTTEQNIREMLSPLSALTESSSSEENGNDEKPNSIKDVYSFTDLDMELRVKTFVYHDIFTSENEELCSLVRCHIWKTGGSDYDGCFVLSTTAVYFLYSTTMNFSNQSSNWFSLNESYRITDIKRVQPIIWYQGLEIQIKNFSFILILMDGDRTQNLIKDFNGPSLKGIKVFPKPNPKVELSLQQSVLSNDLNHNSEDPSVIHMVMCRSLEITKIEVDEEEILRLAALVLTCGLFIVIPGDLSWLCSGAQPSIVTSRDLSSLIEVERKGMQLVFHFLDEAEAVEELWSLKFGVNTQIDSLLDAIRRPWERRFSVPLEITGL